MNPPLTVALVEDSEVVRMGLRALLGTEVDIAIVGEAGDVATGVALCARTRPTVVLLDIRLPDGSGFDACRQILQRAPGTRVLILTSVLDAAMVEEAIRAGAHGYLLKEIDGRGLLSAIRDIAAGKSILDPAVTARVLQLVKAGPSTRDPLGLLSPQEKRVLALIAEGCTNKEVALKLGLSDKTVKNYLSTVFEKLHVSRRAEAAALFAQHSK
jgi:two-component system, NarL family, response regulator DevR